MKGALLVTGTTSDAGKSVLTAGLCHWLARRTAAAWGTSWPGTLENDAFRRTFLTEVAALAGRDFTVAPDTGFAALRQARLDVLGDLVADHLDPAALGRLIGGGPPPGLPVVPPAGPGRQA